MKYPEREQAIILLKEYTKSESLIKHSLAVESCMRFYAKLNNEDEDLWGITGLLHDFDYEMFPDPEEGGHPYKGESILKERGYPDLIREAIMGHATFTNVPRETKLAKHLFACDELSGLVYACVLVRPDKDISNLTVKSVKKKIKDKAFAKGVSREDIKLGVSEIETPLEDHIINIIKAMESNWEKIHSGL